VPLAILFDIAALNVSGIIDRSTKKLARSGRLKYAMRFYLGSLTVPILVTVRFVAYLFHLISQNQQ